MTERRTLSQLSKKILPESSLAFDAPDWKDFVKNELRSMAAEVDGVVITRSGENPSIWLPMKLKDADKVLKAAKKLITALEAKGTRVLGPTLVLDVEPA